MQTHASLSLLAISASTFTDVAFNGNPVNLIDISNPLQVSTYTRDSTSPGVILSFQLNLDQLVFTFDEPVLTNRANFTLLNDSSIPNFSRTLVGGTVLTTELASLVVTIQVDPNDISELKLTNVFGTNAKDTFISAVQGAFIDTTNNAIEAVSNIMATLHVSDTARAQLISFSIDMQTGQFDLTFNDIALARTLDASAIGIQDGRYASDTSSVRLATLSTTSSSCGYYITINICPLDLLKVISVLGLATSENTTWILCKHVQLMMHLGWMFWHHKWQSCSGNFTADTTIPTVDSFLLDLNTGQLNITFSDTVDHLLLNVSLLLIVSNYIPTVELLLAGGEVDRSVDGRIVVVALVENDMNELKDNTAIGSSTANMFLTIGPDVIPDLAGNYLAEIPVSSALQASSVLPDVIEPELRGFDLDLNTGHVIVAFSEPVDSSSAKYSRRHPTT